MLFYIVLRNDYIKHDSTVDHTENFNTYTDYEILLLYYYNSLLNLRIKYNIMYTKLKNNKGIILSKTRFFSSSTYYIYL